MSIKWRSPNQTQCTQNRQSPTKSLCSKIIKSWVVQLCFSKPYLNWQRKLNIKTNQNQIKQSKLPMIICALKSVFCQTPLLTCTPNWTSVRRSRSWLFFARKKKNNRNGGIWQSGISKSLAEYVQRPLCFVAYVIFIMWNSISGLDTCYHFRLNISCGGAVTVRSHQKKYQVTF